MHLHKRALGALAVLTALASPARAQSTTCEQALAAIFVRNAHAIVAMEPMTLEAVDLAIFLLQESVRLDPDNLENWRTLLNVAVVAERDALRDEVLQRVGQLDPSDDVIRLRRLSAAVDRYQTAEERIAAYEKILAEGSRDRLGPAVASHMALDLAFLNRRVGNTQAFADWLAESVSLDPSNRDAVGLAAGYYSSNVEDAYGQAELLKAALLADPTDVETQAALGQLLLENGAYAGAQRLYQMAIRTSQARRRAAGSNLQADLAIAQWGLGEPQAALQSIHDRQRIVDLQLRSAVNNDASYLALLADLDPIIRDKIIEWWGTSLINADGSVNQGEVVAKYQQAHGLSTAQRSQLHGVISPTLATVRAVIHAAANDERASVSLREAVVSYEANIRTAESRLGPHAPELASLHLELASVLLWLGGDMEEAEHHLLKAEQIQPLTEAARDRISGLIASRQSNLEEAADLFERHADSDPASALGLAEVLLRQGRRSEAGRRYLQVARSTPGSVLGVWSLHKLTELLGRRFSVTELAAPLEELAASIPWVLDRIADDASLAVSLRINPNKVLYDPYEPVIINVQVTNNARFPISIGPGGPLRPEVVLVPNARISGLSTADPVARIAQQQPIVIDIGRRLRLEPGQQITVPVDLRRYRLGALLEQYCLDGLLLDIRALSNVALSSPPVESTTQQLATIYSPGMLGMETQMPLVRIEGVRLSSAWLEDSLAAIAEPDGPEDVRRMAMLSRWLARGPGATPEALAHLRQAASALADAFPKLTGPEQAWLLSVMPHTPSVIPPEVPSTAPIQTMARDSTERLVQLVYMLYHAETPADPLITAIQQSGDEELSRAASTMIRLLEKRIVGSGAGATR